MTETTERFAITDESSAGWYLRKLRTIEEEQEAIRAATAARLAELESDRRQLEHLFGDQLTQWARAEAERRRRKTITVPLAGMAVAFRTAPARLEIDDPTTAEDVARSLGYLKPAAVDLAAYRKAAQDALETRGELLPGCRMTDAAERVSVRRIDPKGESAAPPEDTPAD